MVASEGRLHMNLNEAMNYLSDWELRKSAYEMVLSICGYDQLTGAPKQGNDYRNQRLNIINSAYYTIVTDEKIAEVLKVILESNDTDELTKKKAKLYAKDVLEMQKIPQDEYNAFNLASSQSQQQWELSKENNDYASYEPHLRKMIEYRLRFAHYINPCQDPYDYYLDVYEPGMDQKQYDEFFDLVQKELVPIIQKISAVNYRVDRSVLNHYVAVEKQEKLMELMKSYLHFDASWGLMGVSMHPFTNGLCHGDVRVTTAYDTHDISSALFSIIHEIGHATYERNMNPEFDGTILKYVSSGMHESQSRLFENMLGRSDSFWAENYTKLQEIASEFNEVTFEQFIRAINASIPSLIRTEADELTYPIHILIRYEMEKALMHGQFKDEPLNKVWNDYYRKYLGVEVDSDTHGILQDVHWSDGSFGYFPTYALGSAVAAQIMHTMHQQIDVNVCLANNQFDRIINWLKDNIQYCGATMNMNEILLKATGETFNPKYYIDYLKDKYSKLYRLDD